MNVGWCAKHSFARVGKERSVREARAHIRVVHVVTDCGEILVQL